MPDTSTIAFFAFLAVGLAVIVFAIIFLRSAIGVSIVGAASQHAKMYATSYVKGGLLMAIASIGAFKETFHSVTQGMASAWTWWDWTIAFSNPVAAAFAVLVAFLDKSTQQSTEDKTPPTSTP